MEKLALGVSILAVFLALLFSGDSLTDFNSETLDLVCDSNNSLLKNNGTEWECYETPNNYTLSSPNGTSFVCGVNNTGSWECN